VRLRSNRIKVEGLCARLNWPILIARPLNSWPNPRLKMFTLSLVISIPFNRNRDERAGECGYVTSNNPQSWECGCLHGRISRATKFESNERSVFLLQLNRNTRRLIASKHGVIRLRLTNVNAPFLLQSNWNARRLIASKHGVVRLSLTNVNAPLLFQSNRNACRLIMSKHGLNFQFWSSGYVMRPTNVNAP
jgi:hypothetical protein